MFRIRKARTKREVDLAFDLHTLLFPEDQFDGDTVWLCWDSEKDYPVGFCSARQSTAGPDVGFLARAGVLKEARGNGLQKRMIDIRTMWGRKQKYTCLLTYAANWNTPSIISLLKSGFSIYDPRDDEDVIYERDGFTYFFRKLVD